MMEILQHNTTLWVGFSFVLFVVLAVKFGRASIIAGLDAKIAQIRNDIETAERLKQEAGDILAAFQSKQAEAETEAARIIEEAKINAQGIHKAAEKELAETMARRETQLAERLKRLEEKAIADIQNHAAELSILATKEIIQKTLDEKASSSLIDQAVQALSKNIN